MVIMIVIIINNIQNRKRMQDENPLERETDRMGDKQSNRDLHNITTIMTYSQNRQFQKIETFITELLQNSQNESSPLYSQLYYLRTLYQSLLNNQLPQQLPQLQQSPSHRFRLQQLSISMKLRNGIGVGEGEIKELCDVLAQYPVLVEETILKFVGCRSVKRMRDICKQEIQDLTPDARKRAIKYSIMADWKYIVNQTDLAIQCKNQALTLFTQISNKSRIQQTKQQLQQLRNLQKSAPQKPSAYQSRLQSLRKIISSIDENPELMLTIKQMEDRNKKKSISFMLPNLLKQLQIQQQEGKDKEKEKEKEKERMKDSRSSGNMSSSMLKKKGQLQERRDLGYKFYQNIANTHFLYATIQPDNRLEDLMDKKLKLKLGILNRLIKGPMREVWSRFQKL